MDARPVGMRSAATFVSITRLQEELARKQQELATGQIADAGTELGLVTSHLAAMRQQANAMEALGRSNGLLANRFTLMQESLSSAISLGNDTLKQYIASAGTSVSSRQMGELARSALGNFDAIANATYRGDFIFSGINTDMAAIGDYFAAGSPARAAFNSTFQTHFGFPVTDPAVSSIDATAMEAFIDGPYAALFAGPDWEASFSGASDRFVRAKYTLTQSIEVPATAGDESFRKFMAGLVLAAEMGEQDIGSGVRDVVAQKSAVMLSEAVAGMARIQGTLGIAEERISEAGERMQVQTNVLKNGISGLVGVDEYEVAVSINELMISLEASYSVTARLNGLSLLNEI
jgi:flagellar hook-associated protein 3 FlgL